MRRMALVLLTLAFGCAGYSQQVNGGSPGTMTEQLEGKIADGALPS